MVIPGKIQHVFKNVPWETWATLNPNALKRADIDDASEFKQSGAVPAAWIIKQLGLSGQKIGNVRVSEQDANTFINDDSATPDHYYMLISYLKQQVRNILGVQLQETRKIGDF